MNVAYIKKMLFSVSKIQIDDERVFYFKQNSSELIAIDTPKTLVFSVEIEDNPNYIMLISIREDGFFVKSVIERNRLWVIRNDSKLPYIKSLNPPKSYPKSFFPCCYLISNYGILDLQNFKGCNFSETQMEVIIQSCDGHCYSACFIAGEKCIAGNNQYCGRIEDGIQFKTIGSCNTEGQISLMF